MHSQGWTCVRSLVRQDTLYPVIGHFLQVGEIVGFPEVY
jgi:hypothetical protein